MRRIMHFATATGVHLGRSVLPESKEFEMNKLALSVCSMALAALLPLSALAAPIGVDGQYGAEWAGITPTAIAGGSALNGNFQTPGANGTLPYDIYTRDDGTYLYVLLTSTDPNAPGLPFANLYFDTIASTPGTGSDLGFELENDDAFLPGVAGSYTPSAADLIVASSDSGGTYGIEAAISNSFLLNDPLGMGFATTPDGTLVSLHLSQSFGYAVAGGSGNFAAPVELGDAVVGDAPAATPEPGSIALLGTGILTAAGAIRRRLRG